jgi:phosphatidylserine/phosphatidylglycerophosphate/cardiolipin synthase-like enzyme
VSVWRRIPRSALQALAQGLESGRIAIPAAASVLERYVGRACAGLVADELASLDAEAFTAAQISRLLHAVGAEGPRQPGVELVWSGPEGPQSSSRDTGVVVPELFASATRSVLVCGFAISQGDKVFANLARNLDANPSLNVRIFTNVQRPWQDTRSDSEIVRAFAEEFRLKQWPGDNMPRVLYDPRALTSGSGPRSCLHAKCLIVDDERALVTSANFTEAAMDRNIEAGVLVDDAGFAARLRAQFDALEQSGQVHSLPDMQPR